MLVFQGVKVWSGIGHHPVMGEPLQDFFTYPNLRKKPENSYLQNCRLVRDMLVPWRVILFRLAHYWEIFLGGEYFTSLAGMNHLDDGLLKRNSPQDISV